MTGDHYPEHVKLAAVSDQTQAAGEFLAWLEFEKGLHLANGDDSPSLTPVVDLLAEWKEIDRAKIEEEKRAMLDSLRLANAEVSHG